MRTLEHFELGRAHDSEVWGLSRLLRFLFLLGSRKDQLVGLAREGLEKSLWSSYIGKLDNWSDGKKFWALEVLMAIIRPEHEVSVTFL